jgi:hypothetical protein
MNKYLLLRSNKQSGPYTAEELRQMGLKPYDLIWIEGKSAAWRYPGEVDELKPFAPAVEEQPYDRFYKKPEAESTAAAVETPAAKQPSMQQQQQPVMQQQAATQQQQPAMQPQQQPQPHIPQQQQPVEKPVRKEKEYKRVFVTLPSGAAKQQPVAKPAVETTSHQSSHIQYQPPVQQPAETKKPEVTTATENLSEKELYERKVAIAKEAAEKTGLTSGKKGFAKKAAGEGETDIYYPKKRSRLKGVPLAAMIIGMIVMTALGIVIGMSLNGTNGVSLIKRTDPVTPTNNNQHPPLIPQEQQRPSNDAAMNQTDAQVVADSTALADIKKPVIKTAPITKKNTTATDTNQQDITANLPVKEEPTLNKDEAPAKKELPKPSAPNLEKMVFVSNNDFEVGPFGGISKLALTVKNTSDYELNLVVVQLEYLKANKEVYKTENLYFRDIAANSTLTVDAPRSSRGNKINYKITLINSKDHLYHAGN